VVLLDLSELEKSEEGMTDGDLKTLVGARDSLFILALGPCWSSLQCIPGGKLAVCGVTTALFQ